jgi:hypothetical protein
VVTHYVWEGDQVIAEYERGAPIHGAAANLCFHRQTYASSYSTRPRPSATGLPLAVRHRIARPIALPAQTFPGYRLP